MREYQTRKEKVLPKDIYMVTLHMIRGYYRRKENLEDMIDEGPDPRQPHVKGKLTPQKLLPFPWEKRVKANQKPVTKAEDKARLEALLKRIKA